MEKTWNRWAVAIVLMVACAAAVLGYYVKEQMDRHAVEEARLQEAAVAEARGTVVMAVAVFRQTREWLKLAAAGDSTRANDVRDSLQYTIDSLIWVADSTAGGNRPRPIRVVMP